MNAARTSPIKISATEADTSPLSAAERLPGGREVLILLGQIFSIISIVINDKTPCATRDKNSFKKFGFNFAAADKT